ARVEPSQQILEVCVDGERLGLVDDANARAKREDTDGPAAAMGIGEAAADADELAEVSVSEGRPELTPVGAAPVEQFACAIDPVVDSIEQELCEDRVFAKEGASALRPAQALDEAAEAFLRRRTLEQAFEAVDVQLEH